MTNTTRNLTSMFKLACQISALNSFKGGGPVAKAFQAQAGKTMLTPQDCITITEDIEYEITSTMLIDWAKVAIFTDNLKDEAITVENLYLTILAHTTEPIRPTNTIKEICRAMHSIDCDDPTPQNTRVWTCQT